MSAVNDMLAALLQPGAVSQVSQQTGIEPAKAGAAVATALPLLMGALARNAQSQQGAASLATALQRDHDGSVLDNLGAFLGSGQAGAAGAGILDHVFGARTGTVATALGRSAGLDSAQAAQVLAMLAPLVMGYLGRTARTEHLDPGALAGRLQAERAEVEGSGSPVGTLLTNLLDQNGDGSILDDLGNMALRFFSGPPRR